MTLLQSYLEFIKELELLKNITRTAWTSAGKKESTAEHSWRLALFTGIISQEFPELDGKKLLMMALVHDLGEIYDGDISAALLPDPDEKYKSESGSVSSCLLYTSGSQSDSDRPQCHKVPGCSYRYQLPRRVDADRTGPSGSRVPLS